MALWADLRLDGKKEGQQMDKWLINMAAGATLSALLVIFGASTFFDIIYPKGGGAEPEAEAPQADHRGRDREVDASSSDSPGVMDDRGDPLPSQDRSPRQRNVLTGKNGSAILPRLQSRGTHPRKV